MFQSNKTKETSSGNIFYTSDGTREYIDPYSRTVSFGKPLYQLQQTSQNINQLQSYFNPITGCVGYKPIILRNFEKNNVQDNKLLSQEGFVYPSYSPVCPIRINISNEFYNESNEVILLFRNSRSW